MENIHNNVTKVHSKRVLMNFPFGLSLKENTSFFFGGGGGCEFCSLCNKNDIKSNVTHTKDFGEKVVAKLPDYIIVFLNLFTLLLWMISTVHHKIGKKKRPIENSVV